MVQQALPLFKQQTVVDASANTLTLQPNFNTWGDGTDSFWVDQTTGLGNKIFEGNTLRVHIGDLSNTTT